MHFYEGSGAVIFAIDDLGNLSEHKLGLNPDGGESPQITIPANQWFGAVVDKPNSFFLAGCTVSPGFHFDDFEMGDRKKLIELFPKHKTLIEKLTN